MTDVPEVLTTRRVLCAAIPVFGLMLLGLGAVQFVHLVRAEHALAVGVEAGALEATLPRATRASVESAVRRSMAASGCLQPLDAVVVERNGRALLGPLVPRGGRGDTLTVLASLSALSVTRDFLEPVGLSLCGRRLVASCTRRMP